MTTETSPASNKAAGIGPVLLGIVRLVFLLDTPKRPTYTGILGGVDIPVRRPRRWMAAGAMIAVSLLIVAGREVRCQTNVSEINQIRSQGRDLIAITKNAEPWVRTLLKAGYLVESLDIANHITDPHYQSIVLSLIAKAFCNAGNGAKAKAITDSALHAANMTAAASTRADALNSVPDCLPMSFADALAEAGRIDERIREIVHSAIVVVKYAVPQNLEIERRLEAE